MSDEIKNMLLSGIEELCNRALNYDESSRMALASMEGNSIGIESALPIINTRLTFVLSFCSNGIIFSSNSNDDFDQSFSIHKSMDAKIITNNFITVLRFFSGKLGSNTSQLSAGNKSEQKLIIEGDLQLVHELQDILSGLDIDWEEPLSKVTGNVAAHEISRFAKDVGNGLNQVSQIFETQLSPNTNSSVQPADTWSDLASGLESTFNQLASKLFSNNEFFSQRTKGYLSEGGSGSGSRSSGEFADCSVGYNEIKEFNQEVEELVYLQKALFERVELVADTVNENDGAQS